MTNTADYWAHVSAAFVGAGLAIVAILLGALGVAEIGKWRDRRAERDVEPLRDAPWSDDETDEPIDEGKLRVAVRRSTETSMTTKYPREEMLGGRELFDSDTTQAIRAVRAEMPRDHLLAGPPMIEGMTLFAYLKHHAPAQVPPAQWDAEAMGVWASFVEAFYGAAGADKRVAHKFDGVGMIDLKRHFLRALVTLTNTGLTVATADELGDAHARLEITEVEFDAVTEHLAQTLKVFLTPYAFEHVMPQLDPAVNALRMRIVNPARVG